MRSLRERFEEFVQTLDGFENIDELLVSSDCIGKKRADYFFQSRQVIIEQKVLEVDPTDKPQKFADKIMEERGILAYGKTSTKQLFANQPDKDKLQKKLMLKITEVIEDNVAYADKQTRDTREIFSLSDAVGLLVILNERAAMLTPDLITYSISNAVKKRNREGRLRYTQNDGVLIISEAQSMRREGFDKVFPMIGITAINEIRDERVCAFLDMIQPRWAKFNGVPYFEGPREAETVLNNVGWNRGR